MIKSYLITDPKYYTSSPDALLKMLLHVKARHHVDYICIRDKSTPHYEALANYIAASQIMLGNSKLFLHTNVDLAAQLHTDGIHLTSTQINEIPRAKALGLEVMISTHTLEEALDAEKQGADAITFSPIFYSPGKGEPVGLEKLKEINDRIHIKCFALGGIVTLDQIRACEAVGVEGFASIRFFLD